MEIFDKEARSYNDWYKTKLGGFVDEIETIAILNHFDITKIKRILDVGCGTGNYSIKLAKKDFEVVGVDISTEMLKIAMEKSKNMCLPVKFIRCDARQLPFPENYFDAALSVATFEFVSEPLAVLGEMFRVIKKDGKIVIGFINKDSEWGKLYLSQDFQQKTVFRYANLFTKQEISTLRSNELIEIIETLYTPPFVAEDEISFDKEKEFKKIYPPGFLVGVWQKK